MAGKKGFLGIFVMVMLIGFVFVSCGNSNPLVGTWTGSNMGIDTEITFGRDGTYTERSGAMSISGTYTVQGNTATITVAGLGTIDYDFRVDGRQLTYNFMGMTFSYTRR